MEEWREECVGLVRECVGGDEMEEVGRAFCGRLNCHVRVHGLAGLEEVSGRGLKEVWEERSVFRLGFWTGKVRKE